MVICANFVWVPLGLVTLRRPPFLLCAAPVSGYVGVREFKLRKA